MVVQAGDVAAVTDAAGRYSLTVDLEEGVKEVKLSVDCASYSYGKEFAKRGEQIDDVRACEKKVSIEGSSANVDFSLRTLLSKGRF